MDKIELQKLIDEGTTQREIAATLGRSQSTVKHWLKKHGLSTQNQAKPRLAVHRCKCGEEDPSQFYNSKTSVCGKCHNAYTIKKGRENRDYIIECLGSKCSRCQYDEFKSGLTAHHLDPNSKDPKFSSVRSWSKKRIDEEIKGCILLCACCHNALHAREWDISEINIPL